MISTVILQMWDALLRLKCSLEDVSTSWRLDLEKDLKKRISGVSYSSVVIECLPDLHDSCLPRRRSRCTWKQLELFLSCLQVSEEDRVLLCCLPSSLAAVERSHAVVQACFRELCRSAVGAICQVWDLCRAFATRNAASFPAPLCVCRGGRRGT